MALAEDFKLHITTHLQHLKNLSNGVPSGLQGQLAEVSTILSTYDNALAKIKQNDGLSDKGQGEATRKAYDDAQVAVEKWKTGKTSGLDRQIASQRAALLSQSDSGIATPTDLQVTNMVSRLSEFDPLEVEVLYASASDQERRIVEAAATAIGRQPVKHGDKLVWEPLIKPETMTAAIAARAERANPDGAAKLLDLQRIRNTYDALAGEAKGLLHASFPSHHEPEPVST